MDFQAADEAEPKPKRSAPAKKPVTPKSPITTSKRVADRKGDQKLTDETSKLKANRSV